MGCEGENIWKPFLMIRPVGMDRAMAKITFADSVQWRNSLKWSSGKRVYLKSKMNLRAWGVCSGIPTPFLLHKRTQKQSC